MDEKLKKDRRRPRKIGKYTVDRELGRGAFGIVYKGVHIETGETVAIKSISIRKCSKEQIEGVLTEISLLKQLNSEFVVGYIGHKKTKKRLYIYIEFVENGSLQDLIKKHGTLNEEKTSEFIYQILEALKYIHNEGIIHRDIKGANILLSKRNMVKLADFGVASDFQDADTNPAGTPYWMAPEVIEFKYPNPASDIWSVGATAVELLTGTPPYFTLPTYTALYRIVQDKTAPIPTDIPLSDPCRKFLLECFERDVQKRKNARDLLRHPWFSRIRKRERKRLKKQLEKERALAAAASSSSTSSPSIKKGGSITPGGGGDGSYVEETTAGFRRNKKVKRSASGRLFGKKNREVEISQEKKSSSFYEGMKREEKDEEKDDGEKGDEDDVFLKSPSTKHHKRSRKRKKHSHRKKKSHASFAHLDVNSPSHSPSKSSEGNASPSIKHGGKGGKGGSFDDDEVMKDVEMIERDSGEGDDLMVDVTSSEEEYEEEGEESEEDKETNIEEIDIVLDDQHEETEEERRNRINARRSHQLKRESLVPQDEDQRSLELQQQISELFEQIDPEKPDDLFRAYEKFFEIYNDPEYFEMFEGVGGMNFLIPFLNSTNKTYVSHALSYLKKMMRFLILKKERHEKIQGDHLEEGKMKELIGYLKQLIQDDPELRRDAFEMYNTLAHSRESRRVIFETGGVDFAVLMLQQRKKNVFGAMDILVNFLTDKDLTKKTEQRLAKKSTDLLEAFETVPVEQFTNILDLLHKMLQHSKKVTKKFATSPVFMKVMKNVFLQTKDPFKRFVQLKIIQLTFQYTSRPKRMIQEMYPLVSEASMNSKGIVQSYSNTLIKGFNQHVKC